MSVPVPVLFTFRLDGSEPLAEAAVTAARGPEAGEASRMLRLMLERCAEHPEEFVQHGDAGAMFVWAGVDNGFVVPPEHPVPDASLAVLGDFLAAASRGGAREAVLAFRPPEEEQVELYDLLVAPDGGVATRRRTVATWL